MYKVECVEVNRGMFKDAYSRIPERLEAALNEGSKKGWKLNDWKLTEKTEGDKDLSIIIVWEV